MARPAWGRALPMCAALLIVTVRTAAAWQVASGSSAEESSAANAHNGEEGPAALPPVTGSCEDRVTRVEARLWEAVAAEAVARHRVDAFAQTVWQLRAQHSELLQRLAAIEARTDALADRTALSSAKWQAAASVTASGGSTSAPAAWAQPGSVAAEVAASPRTRASDGDASPAGTRQAGRAARKHQAQAPPTPKEYAEQGTHDTAPPPASPSLSARGGGRRLDASDDAIVLEASKDESSASLRLQAVNAEVAFGAVALSSSAAVPDTMRVLTGGIEVARFTRYGLEPVTSVFVVDAPSSHYHPVALEQGEAPWAVGDPGRVEIVCLAEPHTATQEGVGPILAESGAMGETLVLAFRGIGDVAGRPSAASFVHAESLHLPRTVEHSDLGCIGGWSLPPAGLSVVVFLRGGTRVAVRSLSGGVAVRDLDDAASVSSDENATATVEPAASVGGADFAARETAGPEAAGPIDAAAASVSITGLFGEARAVPRATGLHDLVHFGPDVVELSARTQGQLGHLSAGPPATLQQNALFGHSGNGVTRIDDVDGDGVGDMVVGQPRDSDAGDRAGAIFVLLLTPTAQVKEQQKITSGQGLEDGVSMVFASGGDVEFGGAVAGMSDWDGDGVPECAVSAREEASRAGVVRILFLTNSSTVRHVVTIGNEQVPPPSSGLRGFGAGLAALPDIDGDGKQELVIGAMFEGAGLVGAVYVVFLRDAADGTCEYASHTRIGSGSPGDDFLVGSTEYLGSTIAAFAPRSGVRTPDIAVGALSSDDQTANSGAVYVFALNDDGSIARSGKISVLHGRWAEWSNGWAATDRYWGQAVAALPDLDGDGLEELAVGAADTRGDVRGYVDILWLAADFGLKGRITLHCNGPVLPQAVKDVMQSGMYFGQSVAHLGDLDGDGGFELAIASPHYDAASLSDSGAVFILHAEPPHSWAIEPTLDAQLQAFPDDAAALAAGVQRGALYRRCSPTAGDGTLSAVRLRDGCAVHVVR